MNFSLCSSPSDLTPGLFESSHRKKSSLPPSQPPIKISYCTKAEKIQVSHYEAKKVADSTNLVPAHFEGSRLGDKMLLEPNRKLEFVRTLLIDNYDSYTYNIYQELSIINGLPPVVVYNDEWTLEEVFHHIYEQRDFDNIVISPGPGSPTCTADIGICLKLLQECGDIPILGVCLGHQALGYVHGAKVVHAYEPVHGRLSEIQHTGGMLFHDIPSGRNSGFKVVRYHSLVIEPDSLPNELVPLAWTSSLDTLPFMGNTSSDGICDYYEKLNEPSSFDYFSKNFENGTSWPSKDFEGIQNKKILMGIMHSTRPHYGVQFHPESVATCYGRQIFKNFREITEEYWNRLRSSFISQRKVPYTGEKWEPVVQGDFQKQEISGFSSSENSF